MGGKGKMERGGLGVGVEGEDGIWSIEEIGADIKSLRFLTFRDWGGGEGEDGTWSFEEIGDRNKKSLRYLTVGGLGVGWGVEGEHGIWRVEETGDRYRIVTVSYL